jgi:hypothetical protein
MSAGHELNMATTQWSGTVPDGQKTGCHMAWQLHGLPVTTAAAGIAVPGDEVINGNLFERLPVKDSTGRPRANGWPANRF